MPLWSRPFKKLKETSAILKEHPEFGSLLETSQFRQTELAAMLEKLKTMTANDFPPLPECSYTLKDVPKALELSLSPAFYLTSPIDDITNNVIYINHNPQYASESLYPILRMRGIRDRIKMRYFHSLNVSDWRKILSFSGYSEGWAAYVAALSYTLDKRSGIRSLDAFWLLTRWQFWGFTPIRIGCQLPGMGLGLGCRIPVPVL